MRKTQRGGVEWVGGGRVVEQNGGGAGGGGGGWRVQSQVYCRPEEEARLDSMAPVFRSFRASSSNVAKLGS